MVNFPTSLDSLANPAPTDLFATSGVEHDLQHSTVRDILEALEAKVGIDGSAVTSSLDYQMENHAHTSGADDGGIVAHTSLTNVLAGQHAPLFSGCRLKKSANQTTVGDATAITFDQEDFDTDGLHDTGSNTSRITIPSGKTGKWLFVAQMAHDTTAISWGQTIRKNGTTVFAETFDNGAGTGVTKIANAVIDMAATDYVEMMARISTGTVTVLSARTFFSAVWLG